MATGTPKKIIYQALGLYTYPNSLGAPNGALLTADNVTIDRPGVITCFPALRTSAVTHTEGIFGNSYSATSASLNTALTSSSYSNQVTFGSSLSDIPYKGTGSLLKDGSALTFKDNTGAAATPGLIHSAFAANGNMYFTGVNAVSSPDAEAFGRGRVYRHDGAAFDRVTGCGMPEALTPVSYTGTAGSGLTSLATAATALLPSGGTTAYRALLLTRDNNKNLVRGAPSGRLVIYSAGAYTYGLIVPLPQGQCYAGDILQLYRSEILPATATSEPSDDMRQVYEYILQSSDLTAGYVVVARDYAADSLRGAALYTNDTQEGILSAAARPPNCAYAVAHKNVAWYAGVQAKGQALVFTIVGLTGWATGGSATTFTIGGNTYTADTAEDLPNKKFLLATGGTPAQNAADTARSLARCISYKNSSLFAFYATPANATQICIVIKPVAAGDVSTYTLTSAHLTVGTTLPDVSGSGSAALQTYGKSNYLYYSQPDQPEDCPDTNFAEVGSPTTPITGLGALRESLFVFKPEGLFRVTGTTSDDIRVELFDATVKMLPGHFNSITSAGNQLFAFTNQGVVAITESGVKVISLAIHDLVFPYLGLEVDFGGSVTAGGIRYAQMWPSYATASDFSHRLYLLLSTPNNGDISALSQILLTYNFATQAWSNLPLPNAAFGGVGIVGTLFRAANMNGAERFFDESVPIGPAQDSATAPAFAYMSEDAGDAGEMKRFYDLTVLLSGSQGISSVSVVFASDSDPSGTSSTTVTQTVPANQYAVKFAVPRANSYCAQLAFTVMPTVPSTSRFVCPGVVVSYSNAGDRIPSGGRA